MCGGVLYVEECYVWRSVMVWRSVICGGVLCVEECYVWRSVMVCAREITVKKK